MVESSIGKRERVGQRSGGFTSITGSELPGLPTGGSTRGMRTTYNSIGAYNVGNINKTNGRNNAKSGKSMRIGKSSIGSNGAFKAGMNKTATDKMF